MVGATKMQKRKATPASFKKGQVGNPHGVNNYAKRQQTNRISSFLAILADKQAKKLLDEPHDMTVAEMIARRIYEHAAGGNAKFAEIALDRTEGRLKDQLEISGEVNVDYAALISAARNKDK
jgi:hypothetical protein